MEINIAAVHQLLSVSVISDSFRAEQEARSCIRCGDRTRAAHHLRQKKRAMQEVEAKDNQYQRLLEMMHQLGQTRQNKQIMDAYKAGASAFKATLQRQGIQPEQVWGYVLLIMAAVLRAVEQRERRFNALHS
uniref:Uncharacterized protein n=1 Tax=Parascaris equorum TaxID=6256 RepID=A0A914SKM0_PAREQ